MKNKKFKFILNGELKPVSAPSPFLAVLEILKEYPEHGGTRLSKLNLTPVKQPIENN